MRNNLAVSLLALKNVKNLNKFLSILKCENIRYVELPILKIFKNYSPSKKNLYVLKKKLKKNSLKITSIQALFYGRENLSIFKINDSKDIINHLKKVNEYHVDNRCTVLYIYLLQLNCSEFQATCQRTTLLHHIALWVRPRPFEIAIRSVDV